jgi:hypothetical protein
MVKPEKEEGAAEAAERSSKRSRPPAGQDRDFMKNFYHIIIRM